MKPNTRRNSIPTKDPIIPRQPKKSKQPQREPQPQPQQHQNQHQQQYQSLRLKPKQCLEELKKLKKNKNQKKIIKFSIAKCQVDTFNFGFVTSLNWPALKILTLVRNSFGNQGIKMLVKTNLPNLMELRLGYCRIGDEGIRHLTKGQWPKLRHFNIAENCITIAGYEDLYKTYYKNLQNLWQQTMFFTSKIDQISVLPIVCLISLRTQVKISIKNCSFNQDLRQILDNRFLKLKRK